MSGRAQHKQVQDAGSTRFQGRTPAQRLQNLIEDETGVRCDVIVTPHSVSLATKTLADFYLAKAAIKGHVSTDIVRLEIR